MARTKAKLNGGVRASDYISLGVLMKIISPEAVNTALEAAGVSTLRRRKLPLDFMVYYVVCLSLYSGVSLGEVQRCLLEGMGWINPKLSRFYLSCKAGLSQARSRLGVLSLKHLFEAVCQPLATERTKGCWYRKWLLVSIDGSSLEVPDEKANDACFGRPPQSRGRTAFPRLRFAALLELGTRAIIGAAMGSYRTGELTLTRELFPKLKRNMLCIVDRGFFGYRFYNDAISTPAAWLFRVRKDILFPCFERLPDGSFLSKIYASAKDRRRELNGITVRVIEYRLNGIKGTQEKYILVTNILKWEEAPAIELAALYHERWEIETAYDEMKSHLSFTGGALRSKKPELVEQEFYGFLLAHYVIRNVMFQAAMRSDQDPDTLSFIHAIRVIKRKITSMRFSPDGNGNGEFAKADY
ncbi:IS4 family transposase ISCARN35 [bioreactor metagenome]|uniref:IS4 family transposase ISCARN35 n=1 Tax=bioreactor metagenome TaxID=1076179 RepID=A0A644YNB5_9ZZZZ